LYLFFLIPLPILKRYINIVFDDKYRGFEK